MKDLFYFLSSIFAGLNITKFINNVLKKNIPDLESERVEQSVKFNAKCDAGFTENTCSGKIRIKNIGEIEASNIRIRFRNLKPVEICSSLKPSESFVLLIDNLKFNDITKGEIKCKSCSSLGWVR